MKTEENESEQSLPSMKNGDKIVLCSGTASGCQNKKRATSRNDDALNTAMENIHKYVEDPAQKKLLREGDGIGTSIPAPQSLPS
ncbi:hypothetical protein [Enterobacter kobei]|uniref:hypothetical protein n=1 Tax=Enterobacter kobei TaxID=208224 RepID=UPI00388EBACE